MNNVVDLGYAALKVRKGTLTCELCHINPPPPPPPPPIPTPIPVNAVSKSNLSSSSAQIVLMPNDYPARRYQFRKLDMNPYLVSMNENGLSSLLVLYM